MFLDKLKYSYVACLSILTICGLVFFPVEGDCGWTYMDEGYSSFSDSHTESHGGGWTLSGSVSAASCWPPLLWVRRFRIPRLSTVMSTNIGKERLSQATQITEKDRSFKRGY